MKSGAAVGLAAAAVLCAAAPANSAPLTVVEVSAPAVVCVFNTTCKAVVDDSSATAEFTPFGSGAFLQSRTYPGEAGTPAAGLTVYEYRLDFTAATGHTECVVGLVLNFGPVTKLTYPQNQPAQVYVVTQGGLGSVGIQSAEQDGDVITFTFKSYLCAGTSTYFFGLAAPKGPQSATATLFEFGNPPFIQLTARTPAH
jgi:hypothetical protein